MRIFHRDSEIVATTTGSENYFRGLRQAYKMNAPVSINKFLLKHMLLIEGSIRIGRRFSKRNGIMDVRNYLPEKPSKDQELVVPV